MVFSLLRGFLAGKVREFVSCGIEFLIFRLRVKIANMAFAIPYPFSIVRYAATVISCRYGRKIRINDTEIYAVQPAERRFSFPFGLTKVEE